MFKFYASHGVVGLSRFADGRDLPAAFRPGAEAPVPQKPKRGWTSERWLADLITDLMEEENLQLNELLVHLRESELERQRQARADLSAVSLPVLSQERS